MATYQEALDRRIAQFRHYLDLMQKRRAEIASNCFIFFYDRIDTDPPDDDEHLAESKALVREGVARLPSRAGFDGRAPGRRRPPHILFFSAPLRNFVDSLGDGTTHRPYRPRAVSIRSPAICNGGGCALRR